MTLEQLQPTPSQDTENAHVEEDVEAPRGQQQAVKFAAPVDLADDEVLVTTSKGTRRMKANEDMSGYDMYLMTLANLTGELHWPMESYVVRAEPALIHDPTKPMPTQVPFVRSMTVQAVKREGDSLSQSLKWWRVTSYLLLTLGLLCSLEMSWSWMPGHGWLNGLLKAAGGLTPMFLVVVFSLVLLVQRLAWYGWRRCLRLLWGRVTANKSWRDFREGDRSFGVFVGTNKVRSSAKSSRDSDTSTR